MKKIKTLFKKDPTNPALIIDEYNVDTEWVLNGEGIATRKYDGTSCAIIDGIFYKRLELKKGKEQPDGYIVADYDDETGKTVGWIKVEDKPENKYHLIAYNKLKESGQDKDGTYELLGYKIQGNPENYEKDEYVLLNHDEAEVYYNVPTTLNEIKKWLQDKDIEGIVWHHPDGRMVKIRQKDFKQKRKVSER